MKNVSPGCWYPPPCTNPERAKSRKSIDVCRLQKRELEKRSRTQLESASITRWAPSPVINGVITPLNGRKQMANWGYNPTYRSYNPIYNW